MSLFTNIIGFEAAEEYYNLLIKKRRIRYKVPTYNKFYSIYQYDRNKFRELMNEWLSTQEGKDRTKETLKLKQKEVLNECYVRDENNEPIRDCDEKYILSVHRLHHEPQHTAFESKSNKGIHELIYDELLQQSLINIFQENQEINFKGIIIKTYKECRQAEIKDSWQFPIKDRIIMHTKLLKELKKYGQ